MVQVQLELSKEENRIVRFFMAERELKDKRIAIKQIIRNMEAKNGNTKTRN
jgi:hypothetical protein